MFVCFLLINNKHIKEIIMSCIRCGSTRHGSIIYCKQKMSDEYCNNMQLLGEQLNEQCPDFQNMSHYMLKNIAFIYPFTKTNYLGPTFYYKNKKYLLDDPLPTNDARKKRTKFLQYYGHEPIAITLSKKRMIEALKQRWQLYRQLNEQKKGNIQNLEKCVICLTNNVSIECWDELSKKYIPFPIQQKTSIKEKDFTGKPPAKCQKCSLICCWDCWWKWTNNNESCPQCRSPDPAIIPKMVWCEDENNFITYKTRNHYHIYNGGWFGSPTIKDSLCYPVTESISKLEAY